MQYSVGSQILRHEFVSLRFGEKYSATNLNINDGWFSGVHGIKTRGFQWQNQFTGVYLWVYFIWEGLKCMMLTQQCSWRIDKQKARTVCWRNKVRWRIHSCTHACVTCWSTNLWTVESWSGASPEHPAGFSQQGPSSTSTLCPQGWCDVCQRGKNSRHTVTTQSGRLPHHVLTAHWSTKHQLTASIALKHYSDLDRFRPLDWLDTNNRVKNIFHSIEEHSSYKVTNFKAK